MKGWVGKVQKNLKKLEEEINKLDDDNIEEFLVQLSRQYALITLLRGIYNGKVELHGIDYDALVTKIEITPAI
jgi:hypothetical protein